MGRFLFRTLRVGLPLALLLLPVMIAWLDLARSASGRRYAYRAPSRRVVVLGFDGVDPKLFEEYRSRLPALAALAEEGTFVPCRTTNPPESPVAWATFATGLNPGEHGIFDFVRRDLDAEDSYRPLNGMVERRPPVFGPLGLPIRPPAAINLRGGECFWEPVARLGYRVSALRMPLTFPAHLPRGGELICGLGVPDLRGTNGSYTLFAAGPDVDPGHTVFGGHHVKIYPRQGEATARLEALPDPRARDGARLFVTLRFTFAGGSAAVSVDGGPAIALDPGLYSRWVPVRFRMGPLVVLRGLVRFLLLAGGDAPAIYASPIQISPHAPPLPISAPPEFAGRMADRLGLMKTAGWPEDTFAANDRVLDDVQLYTDIRDSYRTNERLCLDRFDRSGAALLTMVFTATDRMSHMFYRYRDREHPAHRPSETADFTARTGVSDPIFESYRWMDETVAAVRSRLAPDDVLMIVSDHGFHTWRYGVGLNTWLFREGYLAPLDAGAPRQPRKLNEFFRQSSETHHLDWTRTRAYALGLGQIYLNLAGRERGGIVPADGRAALLDEIAARLLRLTGPDGRPVFTNVYRGEEIWRGSRMRDAPDLQCAFAPGYRVSWQTALLGIDDEVFQPNTLPWSGDHCSNDVRDTAGVFFSNRRLAKGHEPGLEEIAPTVCSLFGAPPPRGAKAKPLPLR